MKTKEIIKILEENKITNVGKDTPYSKEPFVSQWYWQTAKMHPYRKSKVFYYGPRIDWMYLMEESGQEKDTNKKD